MRTHRSPRKEASTGVRGLAFWAVANQKVLLAEKSDISTECFKNKARAFLAKAIRLETKSQTPCSVPIPRTASEKQRDVQILSLLQQVRQTRSDCQVLSTRVALSSQSQETQRLCSGARPMPHPPYHTRAKDVSHLQSPSQGRANIHNKAFTTTCSLRSKPSPPIPGSPTWGPRLLLFTRTPCAPLSHARCIPDGHTFYSHCYCYSTCLL